MKYTIQTEVVEVAKTIKANGCNAIEFTNAGDSVVNVEGRPIPAYTAGMPEYPTICFYGLQGEQDHTNYTIAFVGSAPNKVIVTRKYYNQ